MNRPVDRSSKSRAKRVRSDSDRPDVNEILKSMKWEERLEAARAKRAVVLAQRAQGAASDAPPAHRPAQPQRKLATPATEEITPLFSELEENETPGISARLQAWIAALHPARRAAGVAHTDTPAGLSLGSYLGLGAGIGLGLAAGLLLAWLIPMGLGSVRPSSDLAVIPKAPPAPTVPVTETLTVTTLAPAVTMRPTPTPQITEAGPAAPVAPPAAEDVDVAPVAPIEKPEEESATTIAALAPDLPRIAPKPRPARENATVAQADAQVLPLPSVRAVPDAAKVAAVTAADPDFIGPQPEVPLLTAKWISAPSAQEEAEAATVTKLSQGSPLERAPQPPVLTSAAFVAPAAPLSNELRTAPSAPETPAALTPDTPEPSSQVANLPPVLLRLNVPTGVSGRRLDQILEDLDTAGYSPTRAARVDYKVSADHVRYYHAEDAARAQEIATAFGAELRDFTSFQPSPSLGVIEAFVAGSGPPRETPEAVPASRSLENVLSDLFNRLRQPDGS